MPKLVRVRDKETGHVYSTARVIEGQHEVLKDEPAVDGHGRALPAVAADKKSKKAPAASEPKGS